jgi:hypothetical protein
MQMAQGNTGCVPRQCVGTAHSLEANIVGRETLSELSGEARGARRMKG